MERREFLKKALMASTALFLSFSFASAKQADWPKEITFGVIPLGASERFQDAFGKIAAYLEKKLGIKVKLFFATDYASVIVGMAHKHIDIAYLGPEAYVEAAKRANAEALAVMIDEETGLPGYYSIIITKKESGLKTLGDLKGKKFAFTDPNSASGMLIPMVYFAKQGIDPNKYFSKVIFSGSHEASILAVKYGKVDAAATNNIAFNSGAGKKWSKDEFNIVWQSDLIPGGPVAARKDLPESLRRAIRDALLSYNDKENLKALKIKGFAPIDDSAYNVIRELEKFKKSLEKKKR